MMKTATTLAALVGYAVAQQGYYAPPPAYGETTTSTSATAPPTYPSSSSTTYACNPAHQYPAGQVCTTIGGSLTLITTTATAPAYYGSSTTSTASATPTCPAQGTTVNGCYSCNPAHQYPAGQTCVYKDGCPCLDYSSSTSVPSYPTTTSTVSVSTYPSATPSCPAPGTTVDGCYSCNPAHEYPAGQTCVYKDGCPCLDYSSSSSVPSYPSATPSCPAPGTTVGSCYSCNPAHQYPAGQTCVYKDGCPCLEYSSSTTSASSYPTAPVYTTEVITTDYTTYCPQPTTFTHEHTTYTVTKATTITLPCYGGCTVTKPVYSVPTYAPSFTHYSNTTLPPVYETTKVTSLTTVCPTPTTFTHEHVTYTVTEATTLTLPCESCTTVITKTSPPVYTTMTVSEYTTYCPAPTTITHEQSTYTITKPETVTLPCSTGCVITTTAQAPPPAYTTPTVSVPAGPVTTAVTPVAPVSSAPSATLPGASTSAPVPYTGAAVQMKAAGSLVAAVAMGALFL